MREQCGCTELPIGVKKPQRLMVLLKSRNTKLYSSVGHFSSNKYFCSGPKSRIKYMFESINYQSQKQLHIKPQQKEFRDSNRLFSSSLFLARRGNRYEGVVKSLI